MTRLIYYISFVFFAAVFLSSCNDKTYAEELKQEQLLIKAFIKRNNINVINKLPPDSTIWNDNDYYLTADGLYFHLVSPGIGSDTLEVNDIIVPRFIQYSLTLVADTFYNKTTIDFPYPSEFSYKNVTQSCTAFHEAAGLMKRNESAAKIIVPSKIGFEDYWTPATPMGYDINIKIQK